VFYGAHFICGLYEATLIYYAARVDNGKRKVSVWCPSVRLLVGLSCDGEKYPHVEKTGAFRGYCSGENHHAASVYVSIRLSGVRYACFVDAFYRQLTAANNREMFDVCQAQYQQHHALCPHGRQPLPVSSPLPPTCAAAAPAPGDGSPSRCDESPQDEPGPGGGGGGGGAEAEDARPAPPRARHGAGGESTATSAALTTVVAPCRADEVMTTPPPPPPDVTGAPSKSTKAPQNHYL